MSTEVPVKPKVKVAIPAKPAEAAPTPTPVAPVKTPTVIEELHAQEDAKFVAAVEAAVNPPETQPPPPPFTREAVQAAMQLPAAQTVDDIVAQTEIQLHSQLLFISYYPINTMTVMDFREGNGYQETARKVLEQFIEQGWVSHSFLKNQGRYSITEQGLAHIEALASKYNL